MIRFLCTVFVILPCLMGVAAAEEDPGVCGGVEGDICEWDMVEWRPGTSRCCKRAHEDPPASGCVTTCTALHQACGANPKSGIIVAGQCRPAPSAHTCSYGVTNNIQRHTGWTCGEVSCTNPPGYWKCDWSSGGAVVVVPNVNDCTGTLCP